MEYSSGKSRNNSTKESSSNGDDDFFEDNDEENKGKIYSTQQWISVLKNDDIENTPTTDLIDSLRHGIPEDLRPMVWEFLTNVPSFKKKYGNNYYKELISKSSEYDGAIEKDLNRTYPNSECFEKGEGQAPLRNILRAYANLDPEVGYTQGMNYIVGHLVLILHPSNFVKSKYRYYDRYNDIWEENAFW
eukprot:CAMPEP_0114585268 /NCGR_PEP_ID=MMETSP0125-20121206/8877_1 /TAXON_ID=485358 ORGANISM="Aristerostoma sp., Strain ATCC 50986" /NCGR_SAMPLE_ID=MMETSP0125 /ASSEMBLY_ACC=CAM_ASM_000245 /LENGTH=188 /DNA_ID=CAMNT_0001780307 /DNA_START=390 /DNA_END=953 /DNA_ORIENTATION=+